MSLALRAGYLDMENAAADVAYDEIPRFGVDLRLRGSGPFSASAAFEYAREETDRFRFGMTTMGQRELTIVSVPLTLAVHTASADAFRRGTPDFHVGVGLSFFDAEETFTQFSFSGTFVSKRRERGVGYHAIVGYDLPLGDGGFYVSPRVRYSSEELADGRGPERELGGLFFGIDLGLHF